MRGRTVAMLMALAVAVGLVCPRPAVAGPPLEQLKTHIDRVIKLLEEPGLKRESKAADRRAAVRRIAEDIFDFGETARRSLGRHWQGRTAAEREEFVQLFADLLERSYISKIELFNGERISFLGDTIDGEIAVVRTKIITKQGSEIPIEYRMLQKGDRWLVYDVIIEGVSLVANYRAQFNKIIQTSSYQELVKRMKSKQGEFLDQDKANRT
jgi:phospholipid transport system substrate-binding protein